MSSDGALELLLGMLKTTLWVTAPLLMASLVAGLAVGIVQAATQINEASIGYAAKVLLVVVAILLCGRMIADQAVGYARRSFESIAHVVH